MISNYRKIDMTCHSERSEESRTLCGNGKMFRCVPNELIQDMATRRREAMPPRLGFFENLRRGRFVTQHDVVKGVYLKVTL